MDASTRIEDANLPPAVRAWLDEVNRLNDELRRSGHQRTVAEAREALAAATRAFVTRPCDLPRVEDLEVAGQNGPIPLRLYRPQPEEALPVILFVHGGGHMAGGIDVYDPLARRLASSTRHLVVAVDYRLAPEHPYPAGVDDVVAAFRGLATVLRASGAPYVPRFSLVGDSAGGALCATLAHRLQSDPDVSIENQVLIYPSLDYTLAMPSVERLGSGFLLERERIAWYFDRYLQADEDRRDVSPLFLPCGPRLPRTLVITAEYCPLRDEGEAYAQRLRQAGVEAQYRMLPGTIHACLNLEDLMPGRCAEIYSMTGRFLNATPQATRGLR
jgi:acetyl esterase/lipase